MRRKIVKQGMGGCTVFLPIKWVRDQGLQAGDQVDVTEMEEGVLISAEAKKKGEEVVLDLKSESESYVRINLNAVYRLGYDKVVVHFEKKKTEAIVKRVVDERLLGFEVVDKREGKLVIENVTEPSADKFEMLHRRTMHIVAESFGLVAEALKNGGDCLSEMKRLTKEHGKYNNFLRRSISKKRIKERRIAYYWELFGKTLLIQHSLLHLVESGLTKKSAEVFIDVYEQYSALEKGYFSKKIDALEKVNIECGKLLSEIKEKLLKSKGKETLFLYHCGELTRLIYLTSVSGLAIVIS
ncbi:hypothetical protein ACFL0V_05005 [Nanoarchaeota archaeon]